MEVVDRQFEVVLGEEDALRRAGGARRGKGHHALDVSLRDAEEVEALFPHIGLGHEGKRGQVLETIWGLGRRVPVQPAVERAPLSRPLNSLPEPIQLPTFDGLTRELGHPELPARPLVQRREGGLQHRG